MGFDQFETDVTYSHSNGELPFYPMNNRTIDGNSYRVRANLIHNNGPVRGGLGLDFQQSLDNCDQWRCELNYTFTF